MRNRISFFRGDDSNKKRDSLKKRIRRPGGHAGISNKKIENTEINRRVGKTDGGKFPELTKKTNLTA